MTACVGGQEAQSQRSFLIEYSPFSRITLTDTVDTLNYHVSGDAMLSVLRDASCSGRRRKLTLP
jgi:hypothetical protein